MVLALNTVELGHQDKPSCRQRESHALVARRARLCSWVDVQPLGRGTLIWKGLRGARTPFPSSARRPPQGITSPIGHPKLLLFKVLEVDVPKLCPKWMGKQVECGVHALAWRGIPTLGDSRDGGHEVSGNFETTLAVRGLILRYYSIIALSKSRTNCLCPTL